MVDLATISLVVSVAYTLGVVVVQVFRYFRADAYSISTRTRWVRVLRAMNKRFAKAFQPLVSSGGWTGAFIALLFGYLPLAFFIGAIYAYSGQEYVSFFLLLTVIPGAGALVVQGVGIGVAIKVLDAKPVLNPRGSQAVSICYSLQGIAAFSWGFFAIASGALFVVIGSIEWPTDLGSALVSVGLGTVSGAMGLGAFALLKSGLTQIEDATYRNRTSSPGDRVYVEVTRAVPGAEQLQRVSGHVVGIGRTLMLQRDDFFEVSIDWARIRDIAVRSEWLGRPD